MKRLHLSDVDAAALEVEPKPLVIEGFTNPDGSGDGDWADVIEPSFRDAYPGASPIEVWQQESR